MGLRGMLLRILGIIFAVIIRRVSVLCILVLAGRFRLLGLPVKILGGIGGVGAAAAYILITGIRCFVGAAVQAVVFVVHHIDHPFA